MLSSTHHGDSTSQQPTNITVITKTSTVHINADKNHSPTIIKIPIRKQGMFVVTNRFINVHKIRSAEKPVT